MPLLISCAYVLSGAAWQLLLQSEATEKMAEWPTVPASPCSSWLKVSTLFPLNDFVGTVISLMQVSSCRLWCCIQWLNLSHLPSRSHLHENLMCWSVSSFLTHSEFSRMLMWSKGSSAPNVTSKSFCFSFIRPRNVEHRQKALASQRRLRKAAGLSLFHSVFE